MRFEAGDVFLDEPGVFVVGEEADAVEGALGALRAVVAHHLGDGGGVDDLRALRGWCVGKVEGGGGGEDERVDYVERRVEESVTVR